MSLENTGRRIVTISRGNIDDQIAALLYATGHALHSEEVSNLSYVEDDKGFVQVSFDYRKEGVRTENKAPP